MADKKNDNIEFDDIDYFDSAEEEETLPAGVSLSSSKYSKKPEPPIKQEEPEKPAEEETELVKEIVPPQREVFFDEEEEADSVEEDTAPAEDTPPKAEDTPSEDDSEEEAPSEEATEEEPEKKAPEDTSSGKKAPAERKPAFVAEAEYEEDGDDSGKSVPVKVLVYILIAIAAAAVVFAAVMTAGGPVERIRESISQGIQGLSVTEPSVPTPEPTYQPIGAQLMILPFEEASSSSYSVYNDGIAAAKPNKFIYMDSEGNTVWEVVSPINEPVIKTSGDYALIAEKNGTKFCLYVKDKPVYTAEAEGNIISASISASGEAALVVEKAYYGGSVEIYNRSGERIFAWNSGSGSVMSAAISPRSRTVAAAVMNTSEQVKSSVLLFDINQSESYARYDADNCAIFSVEFIGEDLHVTGDNRVLCMNTKGKVEWTAEYSEGELCRMAKDEQGDTAVLLELSNAPQFCYYSAKGRQLYSYTPDQLADYLALSEEIIIFNNGRDILMYDFGSGDIRSYTAAMDVYGLYIMGDSHCAIIYSNSIEFIEL